MGWRNSRLRSYPQLHLALILKGVRAIREECGCCHQTVRMEMVRRGIPLRHRQRIAALKDDVMLRLIYEADSQIHALSMMLHVCPYWLKNEMTRRGLWETLGHRRLAHLSDDDLQEVVWANRGIARAAKKMGVCKTTIRKEQKRRGLDPLSRVWIEAGASGRLRMVKDADLEAAIVQAGSPFAACGVFGVSHPTMYAELRRRGMGRLRVQHLVHA